MTANTIQSQDLTIKAVFQDFYRVPDYQREYVWGEKDARGQGGDEVDQFLNDIFGEYDGQPPGQAPEYFIGTVVVCPGPNGVLDLIDGQQRTTTAFLTLCAIRDRLKELGADVPDDLKQRIAAADTNEAGESVHRYRLDLQYEDSGGVLREYGEGKGGAARNDGTRSIRNIANAYQTIRTFLTSEFEEDADALRRFYGYFTNKVKLIRIETANVAKALKIFETINDRGVGLDSMDLLKNLLFMSATPADFAKLKDVWKKLADVIFQAGEKPLRFLRQYILATYEADEKVREDAIYDWLLNHKKEVGYAKDPLGFAKRLVEAAQDLSNFIAGKNTRGEVEPGIINTRALGGKAARLHHVMLLAGRHLPAPLFSRLAYDVESLMFLYLIGRVPAKDYERAIVQGAQELRHIKNQADYDRFEAGFLSKEKTKHAVRFQEAFLALRTWSLPKYRLRYILSKLSQHIDVGAYSGAGAHGVLSTYIDGAFDIEHILSEQPSDAAIAELLHAEGEDSSPGAVSAFKADLSALLLAQKLGNLLLLERAINRSIGNGPYSGKVKIYEQSQLLLTKSLAAHPKIGVNDRITRAVAPLKTFPVWTRQAIDERQAFLAELATKVWKLSG